MTLESEKLTLSVAYAYRQWREAILSCRCAEDVELKERESYETLLKQTEISIGIEREAEREAEAEADIQTEARSQV